MKPGEGLGKAVGRIVAVLERDVYHPRVRGDKLAAGEREPALADVFRDGIAAEQAEALLKIKRRNVYLPSDIVNRNFVGDVVFDISDCFADGFHPSHGFHPLAVKIA